MWISILNYNIGQIEVADVTKDFAENKIAADECPLCVVNNVETHLNL